MNKSALNKAVAVPTPTLKNVMSTNWRMAEDMLACSASDCTENDLNNTTATASFSMLSPNTSMYRVLLRLTLLKMAKVATGSTLDMRQPNARAWLSGREAEKPATPAKYTMTPTVMLDISVPNTAKARILPIREKNFAL